MLKSNRFNLIIILIVIALSYRKCMVEAESDEDYIEDTNESEIKIPEYYKALLNEAIQENHNEKINLDSHKQKRSDLLLKKTINPQTSKFYLKHLTFIMNEPFFIEWGKRMESALARLALISSPKFNPQTRFTIYS